MSVSTAVVLQLAIIAYGLLIIILGAIVAYFGLLGINGKFKPGGSEGFKFLTYSMNSKLFNQDKYWYDINRYAGKRTLYVAILLALLGVAIIVLPMDPVLKMYVGNPVVILIIMIIGFIVVGSLTYRYANKLIAQ
jgi:hypothetical protein